MNYPSTLEYSAAILKPDVFLLDPVLKRTKPVMRNGVSGDPLLFGGGYAKVFKLTDNTGKAYAFRCWTSEIKDMAPAYQKIDAYLKQLQKPIFVDFNFMTQAIRVNGSTFPGMRMDWVDAPPLHGFAWDKVKLGQLRPLETCATTFLNVATYLHQVDVSHGDLQGDNIRVRNGGGDIVLIDYDTMYVPNLRRGAFSVGLPAYQHPKREMSKVITAKDDYFSELVIYLGLIALSRSKVARDSFIRKKPDKEFLFTAKDIGNPGQSPLIQQLHRENDPEVKALTNALIAACRTSSIDQLEPLEKVVKTAQLHKVSGSVPSAKVDVFQVVRDNSGGSGHSSVAPQNNCVTLEDGLSAFHQAVSKVSPPPKPVDAFRPPPPPPPGKITISSQNSSSSSFPVPLLVFVILIVIVAVIWIVASKPS